MNGGGLKIQKQNTKICHSCGVYTTSIGGVDEKQDLSGDRLYARIY